MKNYFITTLLILGLLASTCLQAQTHHDPRADRKGRKMDKKEWKIRRKMFHDHPGKAARKENKSRKKEYKKSHKIEW